MTLPLNFYANTLTLMTLTAQLSPLNFDGNTLNL